MLVAVLFFIKKHPFLLCDAERTEIACTYSSGSDRNIAFHERMHKSAMKKQRESYRQASGNNILQF